MTLGRSVGAKGTPNAIVASSNAAAGMRSTIRPLRKQLEKNLDCRAAGRISLSPEGRSGALAESRDAKWLPGIKAANVKVE